MDDGRDRPPRARVDGRTVAGAPHVTYDPHHTSPAGAPVWIPVVSDAPTDGSVAERTDIMGTTIGLLGMQHRDVLARLAAVETDLASGAPDLGAFAAFLRGDVMEHFTLEEEALFPALERHLEITEGPLAMMNAEHLESGLVAEHQHPEWGRMRAPGVGVRLSLTPGINQGPAPLLGQQSQEILGELGYTPEQIEALRQKGATTWPRVASGLSEAGFPRML